MSQIFLFTGENTYELGQEKSRWVQGFREKHGDENLLVLPAKKVAAKDVYDAIAVAPFIAEKRLVCIEGIPSLSKEEVQALPTHLHPAVLLLFVDPKPDKRLSATKELLKLADLKEFTPKTGAALQRWMQEQCTALGSRLEKDAADYLETLSNGNQSFLSAELQKLSLHAGERSITLEDVRLLTLSPSDTLDWHFIDLLARQKCTVALQYIKNLYERGESPFPIWNMLLWMASSLVQVAAAVQEGITSPGDIAKKTTVKFPSAKTLLPLARSLSGDQLQTFIQFVTQTDMDIKTGRYRTTSEAPEELIGLIDRSILMLK